MFPSGNLTVAQQNQIIEGDPKSDYVGVNGFFQWLERKKYKLHVRVFLSRYRGYALCPDCNGSRLRAEARAVRVSGKIHHGSLRHDGGPGAAIHGQPGIERGAGRHRR